MSRKRKVTLLVAGGTHLLDKNKQLFVVDKKSDIDYWLQQMPELNIMADIEVVFIKGEYDEIGVGVWQDINKKINELSSNSDAFIVISKLESLIELSLVNTFGLNHLDKTIILTASQVTSGDFQDKKNTINKLNAKNALGLKSNLINALQASERNLPAPAIMFGTRLLPATKAIWSIDESINLLASIDGDYWGRVDFGINIKDNFDEKNKSTTERIKIFSEVLVIEDIVGMDCFLSSDTIDAYQAVLIRTNHGQKISDKKIKQILAWDKPVVLYGVNMDIPSDKVAVLTHCTWHTAIIKTMWVMANFGENNFKYNINKNYIGEFNI